MYQRILVPLDGSTFSERIVPHAAAMAAVHATPLGFLRIVQTPADQTDAMDYVKQLAAAHGAEPVCLVADGDATDTILQEAGRVPDTLVAMTSHGRSGLMEAMLGSVAKQVVRLSAAPVLLYSPHGHDAGVAATPIKTVVLPLDGTALSEGMGAHAAELARWLGASLHVIGVLDPRDVASVDTDGKAMESGYVRSRALDLSRRHGTEANWDTLHGTDPASAISEWIGGRHDVVLAMATRGQDAMRTAFLGSVTAGCLRKAGVPLLVQAPHE